MQTNVLDRFAGMIRIESRIPSKSMAVSIYSCRAGAASSESKVSEGSELENVVVYLEGNTLSQSSSPAHRGEEGNSSRH